MKKIVILLLFIFCLKIDAQPIISDNGHPEHIIVGAVIGYLKEAVDPKWFGGVKSDEDFGYSALGGVIGASIVIPLKKRKPKETPNITAAFK